MSDDSSSAAAGWYPDPADDARLRRWDGSGWTQDVILAPDDSPVGFVPSPPAPAPTATFAPPTPNPPQYSQPQYSQPQPAPPQFGQPQFGQPQFGQPQYGQPHYAQPEPPRVQQQAPPEQPPAVPAAAQFTPPNAAPATPATTAQAPSPAGDPADPNSGPVTLPEWATLPGLTLPPDLSMIPGLVSDSVLSAPTFVEPEPVFANQPRILQPPVFTAPTETQADAPPQPPVQDATLPTAPNFPPPPPPRRGPAPAEHYAPPPGGAQYDAPPPPGASPAPGASIALPASSLVAPRMPNAAWASGPAIDRNAAPPVDFSELPRTSAAEELAPSGILTLWVWLIAVLPLLQFVIVYLVFIQLGVAFSPGVQWGIVAAPAAFSLLFASGDRRKLIALGVDRVPSPLLALVPPVYLLVRSFDVGRSSFGTLLAWILLQALAVAGVVYLMPHILSQAIAAS